MAMGSFVRQIESASDATPRVTPGTSSFLRHATYGPIRVRYVKNVSGAATAKGDVACYRTQGGVAAGYEVVRRTAASGFNDMAGIWLAVVQNNHFGYILEDGYYPAAKMAAGTVAIGRHLVAKDTTPTLEADRVPVVIGGSTGFAENVSPEYALLLEGFTSTATGTAKVFVRCGKSS